MKVKYSEKAKAESLLVDVCLQRSLLKWSQGLRSDRHTLSVSDWQLLQERYGREFLLSIYCGARYTVITTAVEQVAMLTEELPTESLRHHFDTTPKTQFLAELGGRQSVQDGQHRTRS